MEWIAIVVLFCVAVITTVFAAVSQLDYKEAAKRLERLQFTSPYARLLGRVVEAKVYEDSEWESMVVVAVSWKGSVAVRPVRDLSAKARWIRKERVPQRVREKATQEA